MARDVELIQGGDDPGLKIGHEAARRGYDQIRQASDAPLSVAAGYLIRNLATGRPLPAGAQNVMDLWRGFKEAGLLPGSVPIVPWTQEVASM